MANTPAFGEQNHPADFFTGLSLPFRAFGLMRRSNRLFALSAVASLVTLGVLIALLVFLGAWTDDWVRAIVGEPDTWYGKTGFWVLTVVAFVILLVVGANSLPLLLLAPLQDPISEATEAALGGFAPPPFSVGRMVRGTWVALGHTASRVAILLAGHALLLLLNLIPGAGSVAWTVAGTAWTVLWLAAEYLDAPMARHFYRFADVRQALIRRFWLCAGFGAAVYVLLWVPVLNFFFVPLAIVAGTLLFRGLRACGTLAPPPGR